MIRVYTPTMGHGSLSVVGAGLISVFKEMGVLAGVVSVDVPPKEGAAFEGAEAQVGLVVGNPAYLRIASLLGKHRKLVFEYAPNSGNQPISIFNAAKAAGVSLIVTPSTWAQNVLVDSWGEDIQVGVLHHGIDGAFKPPSKISAWELASSWCRYDTFRILHHTSSSPERKGTLQLIEAVETWGRGNARLYVSCSLETALEIRISEQFKRSSRCTLLLPMGGYGILHPGENKSWPDSAVQQYHDCHIVCQPSRSEGFGMVPIEARACGTPVVMTTCTGHQEHAFDSYGLAKGVVHVNVHENAPMVCEMGGTAPMVDVDGIVEALEKAYTQYPRIRKEALDAAQSVRERWSWQSQVAQWTRKILGEEAQ